MKKGLKIIIGVLVIVLACIAGLTITYTNSDDYTGETFPQGVTINGTDVSGMTYKEANKAISDGWNHQKMIVVGNLDEPLEEYTDFGCKYDIDEQIASVKKEHLVRSALNHYLHMPYSAEIAMCVKDTSKDFKKTVQNSEFLSHGNATETEDAYVDLNDPDFDIVPEVYGTKPDTDAYFEDIIKGIELGQLRFKFDEANYIDIPDVTKNDPELLKYQEACRDYLNQKIKYKLGDESFTVSQKDLINMYDDIGAGKADRDAVSKYVSKMCSKYDTIGDSVRFTSLTGKTFTVNGGTYGWAISQEGETDKLVKDIESHKDINREPVWSSRGSGSYSKLVGDTYVDVDISTQHLVYFANGSKKFECDVVTGCKNAGHSTPTGLFQILNKARNITLKGGGKKGDKGYYESPVSYWMAFFGSGYGLHDASWRSSFGGSIYIASGSHGCVNMPPSQIPTLYNMVSIGTPVIVHY